MASARSKFRIPWLWIFILIIAAGAALAWLMPAPVGAVVLDNVPPLRRRAAHWLGNAGHEGLTKLVERATAPDPDLASLALDGLIDSTDPGAGGALRGLRKVLDADLQSTVTDLRNQALRAIGRAGDKADFEVLSNAFSDRTTRHGAIGGMGFLDDERARGVLARVLLDSSGAYDAETDRADAAAALATAPGPSREALGALSQGLKDDALPVRIASLAAIETLIADYLDVKGALLSAADADKPPLRRVLGSIEVALTALRAQFAREPDAALKDRMAHAYQNATGNEIKG